MIPAALMPYKWAVLAGGAMAIGAAGFVAGWTAQGWRKGAEVSDLKADAATTTAQRADVALVATNQFRAAEGASFIQIARAANAYDQTRAADAADLAAADAAGAGLLDAIHEASATGGGAVPDRAAAERAGQATRALGAALAACDKEQRRLAEDLAGRIARGKRCEAEHSAAEALNVRGPIE